MLPKIYFDMEALVQNPDMDMSPPLLRGRMLAVLHSLFKEMPHVYAVALVLSEQQTWHGGKLRIFASQQADLDRLVQSLANGSRSSWVRDYVRLHYPLRVPEDFSGVWHTFRRYRIPTVKSDRKQGKERGALRQRRLEYMQKNALEYFILNSYSTKQTFTLAVQCHEGEAQKEDCFPNSYGFASTDNIFYLPCLP